MGRLPLIAAVGLALGGSVLFVAGCTCGGEAAVEAGAQAEPQAAGGRRARSPESAPPRQDIWPEAVIPLSRSHSATRVDVRPNAAVISNRGLVDGWPAHAIEGAQRAAEPGHPSWPRITIRVRLDTTSLDALVQGLEVARRVERAGSGSGRGSQVLDLRVASDVRFSLLRRILYAIGRAGYGHPRLLLGASEQQLVTFDWGRAPPPTGAPTLEQIRLAMHAIDRDETPSLPDAEAPRARVLLDGPRPRVFFGGALQHGPCALTAPSMVSACLRSLSASAVVLEVGDDVSVGRLMPWWQHLDAAAERVVLRQRAPSVRP